MSKSWWHLVGALPVNRNDHAYYALRRVWADHTMTGARGFWNERSEDHLTVVLFQPLACLSDCGWLDDLLMAADRPPVSAREIRFAFAAEETLDARLQPRHGRDFVIADIMLAWRGDSSGMVAFEVKKPGAPMPSAQDVTKLETYQMLPSARDFASRQGIFLVDDRHVPALKRSGHAALGWSMVHAALLRGLDRETGSPAEIAGLAEMLTRLFKRAGVRPRWQETPKGRGGALSDRLNALRIGLELREAALREEYRPAPWPWLAAEPDCDTIRRLKPQSTQERRICRWRFDWQAEMEPAFLR